VPTPASVRERVAEFFAFDDPWQRRGEVSRGDWVVGGVTFALGLLLLELSRSIGALDSVRAPLPVQWLALATGCLLLVGRRRWPLTVALLAATHMFVTGMSMPPVMGQLSLQIVYFVAVLSGVAWARNRRDMALVVGAVLVFMFAWVAWQFAVGTWIDEMGDDLGLEAGERPGFLGPVTAYMLMTSLMNVVYFGGAVIGGQVLWRSARQRARLVDQAATIADQTETLRRRAVVEERLRIARELHDVVAHHVSVIGIQAAAGRRLLGRDDAAVADALAQVEVASREAVGDMRTLLGTLRDPSYDDLGELGEVGELGGAEERRAPEPTWADLPGLVEASADDALRVTHDLVERPDGAAAGLSGPVGASVYRIVQEALTNVRRHSTADAATVVLRVDRTARPPYAEVEVTDNGRARSGTSGSGLGLLGVRERAAARRAQVEIGPRALGGFRVRVRFPLEAM
jgi:signal transduction histidine kinase